MPMNRRRAILEAAGSCFARYGYDKTTLDDIARIVGINKASFYYYFKNKEDIFSELIREEADGFILETVRKADAVVTCKERILKWIEESFSYLYSNGVLNRLSEESLVAVRPYLRELVEYSKKRGTEYLASTLEYFIALGVIRAVDAERSAEIIQDTIYALKDYLHRQYAARLGEDEVRRMGIEKILRTVEMILDGLLLREEGRGIS